MELEGFKARSIPAADGGRVTEYYPDDASPSRCVRMAITEEGNIVGQLLENGEIPGVVLGERVTCPIHTSELEGRILKAMLFHHFGADWLEDGYATVDIEMIRRGYEIGRLKGGELIWFRRENGATFVIKREDSDQLPASFKDPTRIVVVGATGKELVVVALNFGSLVSFMNTNAHYELYRPHQDVHIHGIYDASLHVVH